MEQHYGNEQNQPRQTIIIKQEARQTNGVGTAGFVLALLSLILSWVPVLGWIIWASGFILSFVGMFKNPKGLAIAGFIISLIDLIILIVVIGAIASIAAAFL